VIIKHNSLLACGMWHHVTWHLPTNLHGITAVGGFLHSHNHDN
jgi:hypothetical protein